MNRFFKSIWSDALGVWVATSELSAARGKRSSSALKAVAVAVALMFGASSGAMAAFATGSADGAYDMAIGIGSVAVVDSNPLGNDAIAIGHNTKATAVGAVAIGGGALATGKNSVALGEGSVSDRDNTVSVGGRQIAKVAAGTDDLDAVNLKQLKNVTKGVTDALGGGAAIDPVTGAVTPPNYTVGGNTVHNVGDAITAINTGLDNAVQYDGTDKSSVTLKGASGTQIHKVAAGTADQDAVNLKQLKDAGLKTDSSGVATNAFVAYDDKTKKDSVTLEGGASGTQIHNVKAGAVDMDAVNLKQLKDAGLKTDSSGVATNAFVAYDDKTKKDKVSLGGTGAHEVTLTNVKAGTVDKDAVNLKQLKDAGITVDPTGGVTNSFVAYDSKTKDSVTLQGSNGTQIHELAAGTADQDAVNLKQLKDAGLKTDSSGVATNAFVAYDDKTKKDSVTLEGANGTQIHNVNAGTADKDAVNLKQLKDAGLTVDPTGGVTNSFVAYDSKTKDSVTLQGSNGTQIHNVNAGTVDKDAVNLKQLKDAGITVDPTGGVTNSFVAYDSKTKDSVTLQGSNGTQIHNVNAGTADKDAVNLKQLKDAGLTVDPTGGVTNAFVAYDNASKNSVTLGGSAEAPQVTLTNVKAGDISKATSTDAVNGGQLYATNQQVSKNTADITNINNTINNINSSVGLVVQDQTSREITIGAKTDGSVINVAGTAGARTVTGVAAGEVSATSEQAINGSQLHNTASTIAGALGGGAGVDANGGITAPTYHVGGVDTHDVGSALSNIDGRVTQNTTDIAAATAASKNAVQYDSDAHDKVTLGGKDATGTDGVQLTNVKAGELSATSTDAVNGAQLNATNERIDQYTNVVNNLQNGNEYLAINTSKGSTLPTATGKDAVALGTNAKATGDNAVALGANSVADQPNTVSVGSAGNERRITNVAPGKAGTDAVNMNQLNEVRDSVVSNQRAAFGGVAAAMAMPNMTPREAGKTVVAVGVGNYKGYSAVGVGGTYRSRDGAWLINGAFSSTGHDSGVRAQVGYEF